MLLERSRYLHRLEDLLTRHPMVGLPGARQVGKITLPCQLMARSSGPTPIFDLENLTDLARLDDPVLARQGLEDCVVLDEVQQRPELFPVLRVLADRPQNPVRFLGLGSASRALLHQSSESLAGRIYCHELGGFALDEVGEEARDQLDQWASRMST